MHESKIHKSSKNSFMKKLIVGTLLLESLVLPISCTKKNETQQEELKYLNVFSPMSHGVKQCNVNYDIIPFQLNDQFQKVGPIFLIKQTTNLELFNSENGNYYVMLNPYNRKYSAFYLNDSIFLMDIDINGDKVVLFEIKQNNPKMYVLPLGQKNVESFGIKDNELYVNSDIGTSIFLLDEKGLRSHEYMNKADEEYLKTYKPLKAKLFK